MSVIVSGGSGQKILLDGVEYKGELKLSTKYQWVADKDTFFVDNDKNKIYVSYKGKIHVFASGTKHYRLEGNEWIEDVPMPFSISTTSSTNGYDADKLVGWEHGKYLYLMYELALYRFDGISFAKVLNVPSKETDTSYLAYQRKRIPAIEGNKVYLSFQTRTGKSNYTYYTYCGYIDLDTMKWVDIATLPYPDGAILGFIEGNLYALGGYSKTSPTSDIYKLNGSSWTQISYLGSAISTGDSWGVAQNNKIYIVIKGCGLVSFDGTKLESIIDIGDFLESRLVSNNGKIHLFGEIGVNHNIFGLHQVLEKVLCLED